MQEVLNFLIWDLIFLHNSCPFCFKSHSRCSDWSRHSAFAFLFLNKLNCYQWCHLSQWLYRRYQDRHTDRQVTGWMDGWMTHHPAVCSDGGSEHWWVSPFPDWGIPPAVCRTCEFWRLRVWVRFHRCSLRKYRFYTVGKFLKIQQTLKWEWNRRATLKFDPLLWGD